VRFVPSSSGDAAGQFRRRDRHVEPQKPAPEGVEGVPAWAKQGWSIPVEASPTAVSTASLSVSLRHQPQVEHPL
jgi:hypothetical protein